MRADGGIARGIYVTSAGRPVVVQVFEKKLRKTPRERMSMRRRLPGSLDSGPGAWRRFEYEIEKQDAGYHV